MSDTRYSKPWSPLPRRPRPAQHALWYIGGVEHEASVLINATVERVWEVIVNVEHWPGWTASVKDVERLDEGELRVGSRVRIKQPRLLPMVWTVTELEPGRSFTWSSRGGGVTTVASHRVEEQEGGARATLSIRQSGPMAGLVRVLLGRQTRRYVDMELAGLKLRAETPIPG